MFRYMDVTPHSAFPVGKVIQRASSANLQVRSLTQATWKFHPDVNSDVASTRRCMPNRASLLRFRLPPPRASRTAGPSTHHASLGSCATALVPPSAPWPPFQLPLCLAPNVVTPLSRAQSWVLFFSDSTLTRSARQSSPLPWLQVPSVSPGCPSV